MLNLIQNTTLIQIMKIKLPLKILKYSILGIILSLTIHNSNATQVYNYYEFVEHRHLPQEVKELVSPQDFIVDFSVGHVNSDQYWDVVLATVSNTEFKLAKQQDRLPQQRTLKIFLGNGIEWKLYKEYDHLFRNEAEEIKSSYYDFYSIGTDNLIYFPKNWVIGKHTSDHSSSNATGGLNLIQSFKKYGHEIRFVWDNSLNNLVYERAFVHSYKNEENRPNEYYKIHNHTWELLADTKKVITIDNFYTQHPQLTDTVILNPQHFPLPRISDETYKETEE